MSLSTPSQWLSLATTLNQLSLVPFLALLWTLWHTPTAPRKSVFGFAGYLAFVAVGIPASIYCRQQLGTSMANVDWIHGPCELLLTTANLIIVLGLRDACREGAQPHPPPPSQQQPGDVNTVDDDNSTASTRQQAIQSVEDADALSQAAHHQPNSSSPGLSVQPPHAASLHQLPSAESHPHRRAPGIVRSLSGQCPHVWQRQAGRQLHHSSSRTARSRVPAGVACRPMRLAVAGVC